MEETSTSQSYSIDRSKEKKEGYFSSLISSLIGSEDTCDKCGTEMEYKEGAGSYYCPECQEYRWNK